MKFDIKEYGYVIALPLSLLFCPLVILLFIIVAPFRSYEIVNEWLYKYGFRTWHSEGVMERAMREKGMI
jgi:hypothetical protein